MTNGSYRMLAQGRWLQPAAVFVLAISGLFLAFVSEVLATDSGHLVILQNGSRVWTSEEMRFEGESVLVTLPTGHVKRLSLAQIDLDATNRERKRAAEAEAAENDDRDPNASSDSSSQAKRYVPPFTLQAGQYSNPKIVKVFTGYLDRKELYRVQTSVGTQPEFLLVRVLTDDEHEVFLSLNVLCEAFLWLRGRNLKNLPQALEVELIDSTNRPAGCFRIDPDMARELDSESVSDSKWYVENVIFK